MIFTFRALFCKDYYFAQTNVSHRACIDIKHCLYKLFQVPHAHTSHSPYLPPYLTPSFQVPHPRKHRTHHPIPEITDPPKPAQYPPRPLLPSRKSAHAPHTTHAPIRRAPTEITPLRTRHQQFPILRRLRSLPHLPPRLRLGGGVRALTLRIAVHGDGCEEGLHGWRKPVDRGWRGGSGGGLAAEWGGGGGLGLLVRGWKGWEGREWGL